MEAGGIQDEQDAFIAETGLPFSFIFTLYEGTSGGPANYNDIVSYHQTIGEPDFPILADGEGLLPDRTPMSGRVHPEICAIAPDMSIISCDSGHGGFQVAMDDIEDHAGL